MRSSPNCSRDSPRFPALWRSFDVPPLINIGQGEGRAQYSVALQDAETADLYKWAPKLQAKLNSLPQLMNVDSDLRLNSPRLNVEIDRNRALALGVTPEAIANTLYDAYGNRRISTIQTSLDEYDVILEVEPQYQRTPFPCRSCISAPRLAISCRFRQ